MCSILYYVITNFFVDFSKCGENPSPPDQIATRYEAGFWPWMGSLGFWSDGEWEHLCGTTLVSQTHFITAAHCVVNFQSRYLVFVKI